jgi:hypothetical protein
MRHISSAFFLILTCVAVLAQAPSSKLTAERRQDVERLADLYKMPREEATQKVEAILSGNPDTGSAAVDALRKKGAIELFVVAYGDVKDPSMKDLLLEEILNKKDFSPTACALLLDQLDAFNGPTPENKELRAGYEFKKGQIATLVSRWLEIPDPKIPFAPFTSQPAYHNFSVQARAKAAQMTRKSAF